MTRTCEYKALDCRGEAILTIRVKCQAHGPMQEGVFCVCGNTPSREAELWLCGYCLHEVEETHKVLP